MIPPARPRAASNPARARSSRTLAAAFVRPPGLSALYLTVSARGSATECTLTIAGVAPPDEAAPSGGAPNASLLASSAVVVGLAGVALAASFLIVRRRQKGSRP